VSRTLTPEQKLHKKLFDIRKAATPVAKEGHNASGDFDFARFEDVLKEASRLLDEKRILIVSEVIDEAVKVFGRMAIAKVAMEFEVIDLSSGGSLTKRWSGSADDEPGGKALFKAQTGCKKYFLADLLRIPFGTDPETEEKSPTELHIPPEDDEAERLRAEQDRDAEEPQVLPRHKKPLPNEHHPLPEWERMSQGEKEVGAGV
jgi:ERF superfamily